MQAPRKWGERLDRFLSLLNRHKRILALLFKAGMILLIVILGEGNTN